jgi:branched-chain amino acid transport system permease protein
MAYLGGITSISGAVAAGLLIPAGVAFHGVSQLTGGVGVWETFIGGILLMVTAIMNPEGIAGGIRRQVAERRLTMTEAT